MRNDRYLYTAQLKAGDETEHKIHLCFFASTKCKMFTSLLTISKHRCRKSSSRNFGTLSNNNYENPPLLYLFLVKCLLLLPFHSSSTKLPKQTFKKSEYVARVIKLQRITGFDILNSFTNKRASHETGQSCQVCSSTVAPLED